MTALDLSPDMAAVAKELIADRGFLYIHDLKRVWWALILPLGGGKKTFQAAYTSGEVKKILKKAGIGNFAMKAPFPFLFQSVTARR